MCTEFSAKYDKSKHCKPAKCCLNLKNKGSQNPVQLTSAGKKLMIRLSNQLI